MKIVGLLSLIISLSSLAQVIDTQKYLNPSLEEGQCHSIADTKVYLKDLNSGRLGEATLNEIGPRKVNTLTNTQEESYFFCKLRCKFNDKNHYVWNTQKDKNENFKNLQGFVCLGLEITDIQASSTLSIKTTVAHPFDAVNTKSQDIRNYLKSINYILPPYLQSKYLVKFYGTLNAVANSYLMANHKELKEAGALLKQYADSDIKDPHSPLNSKTQELAQKNWSQQIPTVDYLKKENLVNSFLIDNARFIEFMFSH